MEPSARTLRREKRNQRKTKGVAKPGVAGAAPSLPQGFEGESPFIQKTIDIFNSPLGPGDASWGGGDWMSESKVWGTELETKVNVEAKPETQPEG